MTALLEHIVFLAHRARTNDFVDSAHVKYDASVRTQAKEIGFAAFSAANRGNSVLYYGAQNMRHRSAQQSTYRNVKRTGFTGKRACYAWNGEQDECRFGHVHQGA